MSVAQSPFAAALLDPALAAPEGLTDPQGRPAGKRFDVYRNNVVVSLTEALKTAFPVVLRLVGDEFFTALAGVFLRASPPKSALLMFYGREFPAFLSNFEPLAHFPYMPDIARLELAMRHSYHAADVAPIDPALLQTTPPEGLMASRIALAPAVHVIRSDYPIHGIWRFNTQDGAPKPLIQNEDILITRLGFDPVVNLLRAGAADFITALQRGRRFDEALVAATDNASEFDLTATLGLLLSGGAMVELKHEEQP